MEDSKKSKIEIYALSKNIDKISIEQLKDETVKISVDLTNLDKEEEYLNKKGLISPIREQEQFIKVNRGKEAQELLKTLKETDDTKDIIKDLEERVYEGDKAVEYLMNTFKPCALSVAKAWIHQDRLNTYKDWEQIVNLALTKAIREYSLDKGTQFTTYLTVAIRRDCKENKHKSSVLSVNASAMHKALQLRKAEEAVLARGGSIDDDYAVAKEMGRDVSTPAKLRRFREMRIDMGRVFVVGVSTESAYEEGGKTIGESLVDDSLTGEDLILREDYFRRMQNFLDSLSDEYKAVIRHIIDPHEKKCDIKHYDKIVARLCNNEEFRDLLREGKHLKDEGIISTFFE